jgi:hypothetical protein
MITVGRGRKGKREEILIDVFWTMDACTLNIDEIKPKWQHLTIAGSVRCYGARSMERLHIGNADPDF